MLNVLVVFFLSGPAVLGSSSAVCPEKARQRLACPWLCEQNWNTTMEIQNTKPPTIFFFIYKAMYCIRSWKFLLLPVKN